MTKCTIAIQLSHVWPDTYHKAQEIETKTNDVRHRPHSLIKTHKISSHCRASQGIYSIRLDSSSDLLARGVGFEPTRPFLTTDLAGLPPTRLGQPRPVFARLRQVFRCWRCCFSLEVIFVSSGILGYLFEGRIRTRPLAAL
jgi:hypothetical protein